MKSFDAVYARVHNRGTPPDHFLEKLVWWASSAPDEIFSPGYRGRESDIYDSIAMRRKDLAGLDRRALMCEVLRVLGGYESSWRWDRGRDVTNPSSNRPETTEAGIFQMSGNSMTFSPTLVDCFLRHGGRLVRGRPDHLLFQRLSKENRVFALEYAARLLRFTIRHNGPVLRGEIHPWMSARAVEEFRLALSPKDGLPAVSSALDDLRRGLDAATLALEAGR